MLVRRLFESIDGFERDMYQYLYKKYKDPDHTFISFRSINKLGINPKGSGMIGRGIYGITVDAMLSGVPLPAIGDDIKLAAVYEPKDWSKVVRSCDYTEKDLRRDLNAFGEYKIRAIGKQDVYYTIDQALSRYSSPFCIMYECVVVPDGKGELVPASNKMYQTLGYHGAVDYQKSGTETYPVQSVMYSSTMVNLLEMIRLPSSDRLDAQGDKFAKEVGYVSQMADQLGIG